MTPDLLALMESPAPPVTLTDRMASYFREREGCWCDVADLAAIGGLGGWRTRVSELRHAPWGYTIDNRLLRWPDGRNRSQYRFRAADQKGRAA